MEMLSIVVDIDQTLVLTTSYPLTLDAIPVTPVATDMILYVHKRPWADSFLLELQSSYFVGIWTAATEDYAHKVLQLFPHFYPKFVFTRNQCNIYDENYVKNIGGFQGPVVLIDDDDIHKEFNIQQKSTGCIVQCSPYQNVSLYDQDLLHILKFLKTNHNHISDTWYKQILWIVEKKCSQTFYA